MGAYSEKYGIGSTVRIADLQALLTFQRTWEYHNKLRQDQLPFAGKQARVENIGFYHGGDVLYELEGIPGVWHEQCLEPSPLTRLDDHDT